MSKSRNWMLAAAGIVALAAIKPAMADSLNVTSWGGAYTKSQIEAYHKPFAAKTGIEVKSSDYNGGLAEVRAQSEAKNVTWDVMDVELSDAQLGCDEGLFEKIDVAQLPAGDDGTPAAQDFLPGTLHDCAVATIVWSTVLAYDKSKFPESPKTWADFFDLEKFPGKRGLNKRAKTTLEIALMADGVAPKDVYDVLGTDEGVTRAFKKLDTIKAETVWWTAGAQAPQLLADGEVAMTSAWNGRIYDMVKETKKPFEIAWDGQIYDLDLYAILKGAPNPKAAMDFLKFATSTKPLAEQAKWITYGPARKSSLPLISPETLPQLPTAPANFANPLQSNFEFWADHADELNERFNAWLAQ